VDRQRHNVGKDHANNRLRIIVPEPMNVQREVSRRALLLHCLTTGVAAVSLNVTAVDPDGAGYVTVFPCGARKLVSSLNYGTGETVANAVLAPVSPTGTICLYSQVETDLVVDINGWFATPTRLSSPPNSSQTTNWAG